MQADLIAQANQLVRFFNRVIMLKPVFQCLIQAYRCQDKFGNSAPNMAGDYYFPAAY